MKPGYGGGARYFNRWWASGLSVRGTLSAVGAFSRAVSGGDRFYGSDVVVVLGVG